MKKIIIFFVVLLISVWLGLKIHSASGYVLIAYKNISIETTIWLSAIAIIIAFVIFYTLLRLFDNLYLLPQKIKNFIKRRRRRTLYLKTTSGLKNIIEENFLTAEKQLTHAATANKKTKNLTAINYIKAAFAAQKQNAKKRRDNYLTTGKIKNPKFAFTFDLAKAKLLIMDQNWDEALEILEKLYKKKQKHPLVLKLLSQTYEEMKNWDFLFLLLPHLEKLKVLPKSSFFALKYKVYSEILDAAIKNDNLENIEKIWHMLPRYLKHDSDLLLKYVSYLFGSTKIEQKKAERLLLNVLHNKFDEKLIIYYGLIPCNNHIKQLKVLEKWLSSHENSVALLLSLGRLCKKQMLWGKAKYYFDKVLELYSQQSGISARRTRDERAEHTLYVCEQRERASNNAENLSAQSIEQGEAIAYQELGHAMELQGDTSSAFEYYKKSLDLFAKSRENEETK
jgi:HemY protein